MVPWPGTWRAEIGRTALVSAARFPRGFSYDSISEDRAGGVLGSTTSGSSWNSAGVEPTPANSWASGSGRYGRPSTQPALYGRSRETDAEPPIGCEPGIVSGAGSEALNVS